MFGIAEPEKFFQDFVRKAYDEYLADQLSPLRVKTAVHQLNVFAERMLKFYVDKEPERVAGAANPTAYRRHLVF
jgi:hypothetical protein